VPFDHLPLDPPGDGVDVEPAALLGDPGEEQDLEEKIAELVAKRLRGVLVERGQRFVGLFEQIRLEGGKALFPVPGALGSYGGSRACRVWAPGFSVKIRSFPGRRKETP
jgi:hypothetical protein